MTTSHGRFRKPLDPEALRFSSSLPIDRRLYNEDIDGSIAHVSMLARRRIISAKNAKAIRVALREIRRDIADGRFSLAPEGGPSNRLSLDDVHMAIEQRLTEKIGAVAGLLHTARSRNDQVALDERLFLRSQIVRITALISDLQRALVAKARTYQKVIMPGYTHLQRAQPVLLAHHLLAYVSMLERDRGRFRDCGRRANLSPLGAAALAGTSFPIDRQQVAGDLGFDGFVENSIDAVSDRDVQIEFIAACAVTMMHLSRLAEEVVLWTSQEWQFLRLGEEFTTGSSIMPQKQNPDMAELVRGKTGRVYGDLMALLTVMKGLPLAYNRDMQEDKEPLFDAADTVASSLRVFGKMMRTARFVEDRFEQELSSDMLLATEVADYLARKGMPFRKAHTVAGSIVQECVRRRCSLADLPLSAYRKESDLFGRDIFRVLSPKASVSSKRSAGSTSPAEVRKALTRWEEKLRR